MSERPQERAQGRGGTNLAEHHAVAGLPQPIHVLDRVRSGDHPGQQRHHLRRRVRPSTVGRASDRDMLGDQLGQADLLGQRDHRHQPGIGEQIRIDEHNIHRASGMR
jgi:hypothetical protein